jgi:hypothetical protein
VTVSQKSRSWWDNRRTLSLALSAAITLHNFEEWLTFGTYHEPFAALLLQWGIRLPEPSRSTMTVALVCATILPIALVWFSARGLPSRLKDAMLIGVAAVFLLNVLIPHLIAAFLIGGYAPGVITALLLNLPICTLVIRHMLRTASLRQAGILA